MLLPRRAPPAFARGRVTTLALGEFGSDFQLYPAGSFAVKGKSEQIKVYRLALSKNQVPEVML